MKRETALKNQILLALGSRPDVMIWNAPVGTFRSYDDPDRLVRAGLPGQADTLAVVEVEITPEMVGQKVGMFVGLEIKTEKLGNSRAGTQSEKQRNWQAAVEKRGGAYSIIRSPQEAVSFIDSIKNRAGK